LNFSCEDDAVVMIGCGLVRLRGILADHQAEALQGVRGGPQLPAAQGEAGETGQPSVDSRLEVERHLARLEGAAHDDLGRVSCVFRSGCQGKGRQSDLNEKNQPQAELPLGH
jgi:hypothetical protein